MEYMSGKEIVNLIEKLESEGMSSDKIIEIIKYVEKHEPSKDWVEKETADCC